MGPGGKLPYAYVVECPGREGIEINYPVRRLVLPLSDEIDGLLSDADQSADGLRNGQSDEYRGA